MKGSKWLSSHGRDAHLAGEAGKELAANSEKLFSMAPKVHRVQVVAEKQGLGAALRCETNAIGSRISIGSCLQRWSRTSAAQVL